MNNYLLSGNEAVAQGAWEAGVTIVAAYPGTPSTEISQYLAQFSEVDCQWSANEKVAYEVAYAGALAGKRSMFIAKHVGLNVAMDSIMTSAYIGSNAGFVIISADDPGMHSSQNEQDNRRLGAFAKIPVLEPSSPAEAKVFIKQAFEISEQFDIPVLLRMVTRICHTKENMTISQREEVTTKPYIRQPQKTVMVPGFAYQRHIDLETRIKRLEQYSETSTFNFSELNNLDLGIITHSSAYLYVKEMFPNASILKLGMTYPFPTKIVEDFAGKVKKLQVIEEGEPIIEDEVKKLGLPCQFKDPSFRIGELKPELLPDLVQGKQKHEAPKLGRKPRLCQGCPHDYVFDVLKELDVTVTGDIGCYTLGVAKGSLHTCLCMGASVTFLETFSKVLGHDKVVGVIGDSTFAHTGVAGLINAAYNNAKGLLLILDNSTTAMTGGQPNPLTGFTLKGEKTKRLDPVKLSEACGADTVDRISPQNKEQLKALIQQRLKEENLSVIVIKSACVLLKKPTKVIESYQNMRRKLADVQ